MPFHENMSDRSIIGEAAVNLALRREEINVESLLRQLNMMKNGETSEMRAAEIAQAKAWLKRYAGVSSRDAAGISSTLMTGFNREAGSDSGSAIQLDD